jgi:hypothetical protein
MLDRTIDQLSDVPWDRYQWHGNFVSADGAPTDDFKRDDVDTLLAYGSTPDGWDGSSAGVVRLKDGRIVAWESGWGPTGSGFCEDAYGGDADIIMAHTVEAALPHISEASRELLRWATDGR